MKSLFLLLVCCRSGLSQTAAAQNHVATIPLNPINGIAWDVTLSRFLVGSGSNVLVIDPDAVKIVDTIPAGASVDHVAVSDDGAYVYASVAGAGTIKRIRIQDHVVEANISLGISTGGNIPRVVLAMVVLPGQPLSLLVATGDRRLAVLDGNVLRNATVSLPVNALYARASDGAVFGIADDGTYPNVHDQMYQFGLSNAGVSIASAVPVDIQWNNATSLTWTGNLVASRNPFESFVYDLSAGNTVGRLPLPGPTSPNAEQGCLVATDPSAASAIAYQYEFGYPSSITRLVQYSLPDFQPIASLDLTGIPPDESDIQGLCGTAATWGKDGILIAGPGTLYFLHTAGMTPLPAQAMPTPTTDINGAIHLALPANGLVYDATRNLLWASLPGLAPNGNSVVSIDPGTGNIVDRIGVGSEPGALAISPDGSHLFAGLGGSPAIESIDLAAKQGTAFSILNTANSPYYLVTQLAPVAGSGNSVAAVRTASGGVANGSNSVIAYDAGIARKNTIDNGNGNIYSQYLGAIFPADVPNTYYAADTYAHYADGSHEIDRLVLDSGGFKIDTQLNNLLLGSGGGAEGTLAYNQPASLIYDSSQLYTSAGQIFTPDARQFLGSVTLNPAYGFPVPFADHGGIVYVQSASPKISANFYDSNTLLPLTSIPLTNNTTASGLGVNATAAVRAGNSVAIAANGEIVIAPLTVFQTWPSATGAVQTLSIGVQQISLPVNAIAALPGTSKLLMATPSRAGSNGNSIVTFNSDTNQIESAGFIGSEPSMLAATPDGTAAYAYLSGENHLARFNIASGSRDLIFSADPTGGSDQQYGVFDMAMGADGGLAVSTQNAFIGLNGGFDQTLPSQFIGVFDNGVLRPQIDVNANEPATLELAFNDSGSRLYAFNSYLSTFELIQESVSANGIQFLSRTQGLLSGYLTKIRFAEGLIYGSDGSVVDPHQLVGIGKFSDPWMNTGFGNAVVPDVADGRVYFATVSGILVFDVNTYAVIGRLPISFGGSIQNYPVNMVLVGSSGLAFLTNEGQVYVVSIASIPLTTPVATPQPPYITANGVVPVYSSVSKIQPGSWISIFGNNLANQTAVWKGDFPTSLGGTTVTINYKPAYLWYVSPTQINVQAPDDSFVGLPVQVTVTTANGSATTSVMLSQFAPSLNLFDSRHVAAEIVTPNGGGTYGGGTYDLAGAAGQFAFQSRPVKAGETLVLYGVGFGPTTPTVSAGQLFSSAAPTINPVTVSIGGQPAKVTFSGLVGAGLYQINTLVPNLPPGDQAVQASVSGVNALTAFVAVQ